MLGGLCVGVGRLYTRKNNVLLSAGILFVAAGRTSLTAGITYTHKVYDVKCIPPKYTLNKKEIYLFFGDSCKYHREHGKGRSSLHPHAVVTTESKRIYTTCLKAGFLFLAFTNDHLCLSTGLSNIIGIIVYISSNAGDPSDKKDEDKKNQYNYGWSFYFGALSFIVAESVGVLAVNIYIEKNKETRFRGKRDFIRATSSSSPYSRIPSYRYRRRRSRSSSRSTDPSREASPVGMKMGGGSGGVGLGMGLPMGDISMYTLSRDPLKGGSGPAGPYSPERNTRFLQVHNCFQKDVKNGANRRTTPV